ESLKRAKDKATSGEPDKMHSLTFDANNTDMVEDEVPLNSTFVESFYGGQKNADNDLLADSLLDEDLTHIAMPTRLLAPGEKGMQSSFTEQVHVLDDGPLLLVEDHFGNSKPDKAGPAKEATHGLPQNLYKWDSNRQQKVPLSDSDKKSPVRVSVR